MHELSIALELVERIEALRRDERADAVTQVTLSVGSLSGVDAAALEMAIPIAVEDTALAGAAWDIRPIAAAVHCNACGQETEPDFIFPICAACEATDVTVVRGRELVIDTVELESA